MTARIVRADYDALAEMAKSFDCEAENTRRTLNQLHRDLDALLDGDWVGRGATPFYREMISDVLPAVKRVADALEQAAGTTRAASRIMKQAEADSARLFTIDWAEYFRQRVREGGPIDGQLPPGFPGPFDDVIIGILQSIFGAWGLAWYLETSGTSQPAPTLPPPGLSFPTPIAPTTTPLAPASTPPPAATLPPTAVPTGTTMYISADGVNLRENHDISSTSLGMLPAGTPVQLLNPTPVQGGEHVWYQVSVNGDTGWVAGEYLSNAAPAVASSLPAVDNLASSGGETPLIVSGATMAYGNKWYVAQAANILGLYDDHFGVDVSSTSDANIYAPYKGEVIASDSCSSCTETESAKGNVPDNYDKEYNFGYGAMSIVEHTYADMTTEQLNALSADGIELKEGQSLYVMSAHLNPSNVPASGTILEAGDTIAVIGNSGNSYGAHLHMEVAINDSGLRLDKDEAVADFWLSTVVHQEWQSDDATERQGNRVDPTLLFDLGE